MYFSAHFVKSFFKHIFPTLRKTQVTNLSYGVYGQIQSQSGLISEIVRKVPGAKKHRHRFKRFFRFLSNPRVKPQALRLFWIRWCISVFNREAVVKVAIDWTSLPGNIQCLMIAIPYHGRAIPILWQLVKYEDIKDSQNRIEERLVARLVTLIKESNPSKKILLTADRGFGRATFIQLLLKKNMLFVLRVKGDVMIKTSIGKSLLLRKIGKTLSPNTPVWYENISYRNDGIVTKVNLAAVVAPQEDKEADPWFLVTNLRKASTTIKRYHERFQIEEYFKDGKHQLGIADIQTRNLMRIRRMIFISCISHSLCLLVGTVADRLKNVKDTLISGGKKAASRVWFALKIIQEKLLGRVFWTRVYRKGVGP